MIDTILDIVFILGVITIFALLIISIGLLGKNMYLEGYEDGYKDGYKKGGG